MTSSARSKPKNGFHTSVEVAKGFFRPLPAGGGLFLKIAIFLRPSEQICPALSCSGSVERPSRRAAKQGDELAPLQLTELHPLPPNHGVTA
jgi:hypothetical protein